MYESNFEKYLLTLVIIAIIGGWLFGIFAVSQHTKRHEITHETIRELKEYPPKAIYPKRVDNNDKT